MTALDFLSPALARDEGAFHPVARSAAERVFAAAGAIFDERDGWRVPTIVPDTEAHSSSVGIADLSHLGKLDVRPAPSEPEPNPEPQAGRERDPQPEREPDERLRRSVTSSVVYRLSPRRALVLFAEKDRVEVSAALGGSTQVLDVTGAYTVLAVTGPEARALIARLTHLHHFPSGGEVAHVTAHVLPAGDGFRILVAQELGHYLAEVALDRAQALGGGLVGVDALPEDERP